MSWWNTAPHKGVFGSQTIVPPAWPDVDERLLAEAAQTFEKLRDYLRRTVIPGLQVQMMAISDAWDGAGSDAACRELSSIIDEHEENANNADGIAKKLLSMESSVAKTKILANANAEATQQDCEQNLFNDAETAPALNEARVAKGLADNVQLTASNSIELAGNIGVPAAALGVDGNTPDSSSPRPTTDTFTSLDRTASTVATPDFFAPSQSHGAGSGMRSPSNSPAPQRAPAHSGASPNPVAQPQPAVTDPLGAPSVASGSSPSGGGSAGLGSAGGATSSMGSSVHPAGSGGNSAGSGTAGKSPSVSPATSGDSASATAGRSPGAVNPLQPTSPPSPPLSGPSPASPLGQAPVPAQPSAPPASPPAPTSAGFAGGGVSSGAAGGAPAVGSAPMPLAAPTTPAPAAPAAGGPSAVGPTNPGPAAAPTSASAASATPAPVPVSAARAERDAIAAAAAAGALRRQNRGNDPTQLARRVSSALNVGIVDFGFFWVTAVTNDGSIVVANSYGIGYVPANVLLPEQVHMATADESIPVVERARWATYPILALQGWARHRDERLRLVIATEDQFQGFDPGVPAIILQPDDIPEDGTMRGRTRLQILAPGPAAQLAAMRDEGLADLLPPAHAEPTMPKDDLAMSWFEVSKPLMSRSTGRARAHLEAMSAYAVHATESALRQAQTEPAFQAQRAAIADWLYWQHQRTILTEALESITVAQEG